MVAITPLQGVGGRDKVIALARFVSKQDPREKKAVWSSVSEVGQRALLTPEKPIWIRSFGGIGSIHKRGLRALDAP